MNFASAYLPSDFAWPHFVAISMMFGLWAFYNNILGTFGRGSLNMQLHAVRRRWFSVHQRIHREHRVIDAILLGHISSSISYFGSATLIVLAGLVGTLANVNRIHAMAGDLKFLAPMSVDMFTLNFAILTLILALSFFAFTYALRKMAYTCALLGGLQETPEQRPDSEIMVEQAARVLTEAVRSINNGIRGFYYAIAALFLFGGPYVCIGATVLITAVLYYRQLFSPTAIAIGKYVEAMNRLGQQ